MDGYLPPAWPAEVGHPAEPQFVRRAVAWLLDCCPGDYRGFAVLRQHPPALARLAVRSVAARGRGVDDTIAAVRAELTDAVPAAALEDVLAMLAAERAYCQRTLAELRLVEHALRGGDFTEPL